MDKTEINNAIWNRIDGVYIPDKERTEMAGYQTNSTRCLGIDPGLANCGWSVVNRNKRGAFSLIASGCIQTDKKATTPKRMLEIHTQITSLIREHTPNLLAVELVFYGKNVTSALSTQSVITLCLLSAQQAGIPSLQITPQRVKAAVTGSGRADKQRVRHS